MKILVIGAGYVGLASAVGWALQGHQVSLVEKDQSLASQLAAGKASFFDPFLAAKLSEVLGSHSLVVSSDQQGLGEFDALAICVGTPMKSDGNFDLTEVSRVLSFCEGYDGPVLLRSTVQPGFCDQWKSRVSNLIYNPEFLREGFALEDFLRPHRVVLGGANRNSSQRVLEELYKFVSPERILWMSHGSAEVAKLGSNLMLAARLSAMNELSQFGSQFDVSMPAVESVIGADPRIGNEYLKAGLGFGGPCLEKDVIAIATSLQSWGFKSDFSTGVLLANEAQFARVRDGLLRISRERGWKKILFCGVTFKKGSSDLRNSLNLRMALELKHAGLELVVYDPLAASEKLSLEGLIVANDLGLELAKISCVVVALPFEEVKTHLQENLGLVDVVDLCGQFPSIHQGRFWSLENL